MEGTEKASTTVDISKELLLRFKSMCVLKELTMSEVIEELIRDWVSKNAAGSPAPTSAPPAQAAQAPAGAQPAQGGEPPADVSDQLEGQTEEEGNK